MTIQESQLIAFKRIIARELGHLIAVREAGFQVRDVQIDWPLDGSPIEVRRPALGLLEAAKRLGPKTYIEKRLFVLCAGGYGECLVVRREKEKSGEINDGDEFWKCFQDDDWAVRPGRASVSDYKKARELAAVYQSLVEPSAPPLEEKFSEEFHSKVVHEYMGKFGLLLLHNLLTAEEFLGLVDNIVEQEVGADRLRRSPTIVLGSSTVDIYVSGKPVTTIDALQLPEANSVESFDKSDQTSAKNTPLEIQRIFGHELGHWLAAEVVGLRTSGVSLTWKRGRRWDQYIADGHCTVFVGSACATLGFQRYLASRIATMVAGPLADCWMRSPGKMSVGGTLYMNLFREYGADDFEKAVELIIIHAAQALADRQDWSAPVDREVGQEFVLRTIVGILRQFGIWELILSDSYLSFIYGLINKKQKEAEDDWRHTDKFNVEMPSGEISEWLSMGENFCKLVQEAKALASSKCT